MGANQLQKSVDFDGEGEFPQFVTVCGCMDDTACNYNAEANNDDGSVWLKSTSVVCAMTIPECWRMRPNGNSTCDLDECGVPNEGIPAGLRLRRCHARVWIRL